MPKYTQLRASKQRHGENLNNTMSPKHTTLVLTHIKIKIWLNLNLEHSLNKVDDIIGEPWIRLNNIDNESLAKDEQYGQFVMELFDFLP